MRLELTAELGRADAPLTRMCFFEDRARVIAVERVGRSLRVDDRDADTLAPIEGPAFDLEVDGGVPAMAASPDGRLVLLLVRLAGDGTLHLIDRARGDAVSLPWGLARGVWMRASRDGQRFVAAGQNRAWTLDADTRTVQREERADAPPWYDWDGARLLVREERGVVALLDDATRAVLGRWSAPEEWFLDGAGLAEEGGFWVTCTPAKGSAIERDTSRAVRVSRHNVDGTERGFALANTERAFSTGWTMGESYALASEWGVCAIARFDEATMRIDGPPTVTRPATLGALTVQDVSRDGERFVGSVGGVPYLVDLARERSVTGREGPSGLVTALALSCDERHLAVTWRGGVAATLEADSLTTSWTFEHGHDWLEACAFAPDARTLYTLSENALYAWDLARGVEADRVPIVGVDNDLRARSLDLWSLTVSPDGARAFALGRDEYDEADLAITFDLATARILALGDPSRLPLREALPAAAPPWSALTLTRYPLVADDLCARRVDLAAGDVIAEAPFNEATWDDDVRPDTLDYGWLTLPARGDVALFDPAEPDADSPWVVRWNLAAQSLVATRSDPGYSMLCDVGLVVRVERCAPAAPELVVREAATLAVAARYTLPRGVRPTEAILTRDGRALYLGTQRGAVMRFALRDDES